MSLTWYAVNNRADTADLPDLEALGISMSGRSQAPMSVQRDPESQVLVVNIGAVTAWKDGRVTFRPRLDAPPSAETVLIRTALDCLERDLHRRDRWEYRRATKDRGAYWCAHIMVQVPEGSSLFAAYADVLRPARRHDRAASSMERAADHLRRRASGVQA